MHEIKNILFHACGMLPQDALDGAVAVLRAVVGALGGAAHAVEAAAAAVAGTAGSVRYATSSQAILTYEICLC